MNPNYLTARFTSSTSGAPVTLHQYMVDYSSGQFFYNSDENRFEFLVEANQPEAKRSVCPCCVNKQRSQVKGAKANKIFQKGRGVISL